MHPVLLRFEAIGLTVGTHESFVGLGVAVAALVVVLESGRRGMWGDGMLVAVAGGLVGGALGMRAAGFLRDPSVVLDLGVSQVWQFGAKSVLGGLTGAYAGVVVGKRLIGYRERTGDVFAPAVALGMAVGRVGCLLTEPPGRPTSMPWGVTLTAEQAAAIPACPSCAVGLPLHPSFGYEIAFHLAAFAALLWLRGRLHRPGALLTAYLAAYAVFRFGVEYVRDNEVVLAGLTRGQLFLLALAPLLGWRLAVLRRDERRLASGGSGTRPVAPEGMPA
ncbi:MAG: prolipoprotein diacylglyceryl transferase [Kineosporiaceae bacterium]